MASIKEQKQYEKVGRLRKPVADAIGRRPADIYIDQNHLRHIFNRHKDDLAELGLTPILFVNLVVSGFNRIYKAKRQALYLIIQNGNPKVVVIEMNYAFKKGFYEVKTATVMRGDFFDGKELLWEKHKKGIVLQSECPADTRAG